MRRTFFVIKSSNSYHVSEETVVEGRTQHSDAVIVASLESLLQCFRKLGATEEDLDEVRRIEQEPLPSVGVTLKHASSAPFGQPQPVAGKEL